MKNLFLSIVLLASPMAFAQDDTTTIKIVFQGGKIEPAEVKVPAGKRIAFEIENKGPGASEFESHDLKREKVVPEGKTITVVLGTLKKGKYKFFDEFHEDTAKAVLIAE